MSRRSNVAARELAYQERQRARQAKQEGRRQKPKPPKPQSEQESRGSSYAAQQAISEVIAEQFRKASEAMSAEFFSPRGISISSGDAMHVQGKPQPRYSTGVCWDDIVGLEGAKEAIKEAVVYPTQHAELYKAYARKPCKGILLWGPPGCGKTMLGKACATALGADHPDAFNYVKAPELHTQFMGQTEQRIRDIFRKAARYQQQLGKRATIFIDEADAIMASRDGMSNYRSFGVTSFLTEMDGLETSGAFVILGTNRPDSLDGALTRDGRIDRRIEVPRPDEAQALALLKVELGRTVLAEGIEVEPAASQVLKHMWSDAALVRELHGFIGAEPRTVRVCLRHCLNGAAIVGVVGRAIDKALARDRRAGTLTRASGITLADLEASVFESAAELARTDISGIAQDLVAQLVSQEAALRWHTGVGGRGEPTHREPVN